MGTPVKRFLSYHVGNLQGIGSRERQEDAFAFANVFDVKAARDKGLLFVVCDGMGGMQDGNVASDTAVKTIKAAFSNMNMNGDIASQMKECMHIASNNIASLIGGYGGSTAVVGIIYRGGLYYVSIGDSFLYLKRGDNLYRLNIEHNLKTRIFQECIESGEINPEEGRTDPERASLTSFLGIKRLEEIDASVRPLPVKNGDVFLACSDGVGGVLSEEEVMQALSINDPQIMCNALGNMVEAHGKRNQDNYTAVVVKCCD